MLEGRDLPVERIDLEARVRRPAGDRPEAASAPEGGPRGRGESAARADPATPGREGGEAIEIDVARLAVRADPLSLSGAGEFSLGAAGPVVRGSVHVEVPHLARAVSRVAEVLALAGRPFRPPPALADLEGNLELEARIENAPLRLPREVRGSIRAAARNVRLAGRTFPSIDLDAEAAGGEVAITDLTVRTTGEPSLVTLSARAAFPAGGGVRASVGPIWAVLNGRPVRQWLFAKGFLDPDGTAGAVIDAPKVDLSLVKAVLPRAPALGGRLSIRATAGGPPGHWDAGVRVSGEKITAAGIFIDRVALEAATDGRLVSIERLHLDRGTAGSLEAHGTLWPGERSGTFAVEARRLALGPFAPFLPLVRILRGSLTAQILASGSLDAPEVHGFLGIDGGSVHFSDVLATFDDVEARVAFEGRRAVLESLSFDAAGGRGVATGAVTFAGIHPSSYTLDLRGRNMLLLSGREMRLRADTDLVFFGTPRGMDLEGDVHVTDFRYFRDFRLLKRRPLSVAAGGLASPFRRALVLDVTLTSAPELWVDNREALIRAKADFKIAGTAAEPRLDGNVHVIDGRVTILYRTFWVREASVTFVEGRIDRPWISASASADVSGIRVTALIHGPADKPEVRLSSVPPLQEADIVTLLATGATREGLQESGAASAAASTAAKYVLVRILDRFRGRGRDIGILDRLSFNVESGQPGAGNVGGATAGEVAGPRFTVNLELTDHWETQVERDRFGFYNFDVFYRWRFR